MALQIKYPWWALVLPFVLSACQPQGPNDARDTDAATPKTAPIIVNKDSVTMAPENILSIKSSRYQPSLGLQGTLEPIKETTYQALKAAKVTQVLVQEGQWVEKDAPLLVLESSHTSTISDDPSAAEPDAENTHKIPRSNAQNAAKIQEEAAQSHAPLPKAALSEAVSAEESTANTNGAVKEIETLQIRARFAGRVSKLYVKEGMSVDSKDDLVHLADDRNLQFIAKVPLQAKSQLSVGQTVNFSTNTIKERFTGQISELLASHVPNQLLVAVQVLEKEGKSSPLRPNMVVTGRVNYGQIEVGTIVPERGIHDADLSALKSPPYQPLSPLSANVWIIKQDQRLMRQPVEVIEYDPSTKQYLVAGISNDSLICLADLPIESAGKKVVIS